MPRAVTRKFLLRTLALLAITLVIVLLAWMVVAGPVTVARIVRYGDTNIDDFSHYPGRELDASQTPFLFEHRGAELHISPNTLIEIGELDDLDSFLEMRDSIAFLVVQGDSIVHERYFQGHSSSSLSQIFSMSKSITSLLVGMAIDDGLFRSTDQAITDFVPELTTAGFEPVTIHHLLSMTSGSSYIENDNPFGEHVILNFTPALEQQILKFEMQDRPGEVFRYKSGDTALLALALDRALGAETITDYAQRRLWAPLGMQDQGVWSIDHEDGGLEKAWCCLAASPRDLAKIGRLILQRGMWQGQRLLSEDWIERSTASSQVQQQAWPDEYRQVGWRNYGYYWWLASRTEGDFFALGKDGQLLYLNPAQDVLILRLGWSSGGLRTSQWISLFQNIAQQIDE